MRALLTFVAVMLLGAVVWLAVRYGDRLYCRMRLNKATHFFLTGRRAQAIDGAVVLLDRRPKYQPALESAVVWLAAESRFGEAWQLAADRGTTASLSPPARYQLAVCAYERGDDLHALALFESLATSAVQGAELPLQLVNAYVAMAHGRYDQARTKLEATGEAYDGTLFYHSLAGSVCYARGDIAAATGHLSRALELREENPRARLCLAVCQAMRGDQPAMERLLDQLEAENRRAYSLAREEMETWLGRSRDVSYVSAAEQAVHRQRVINLRLANAAIDVRENRFDLADQALAGLARDYPDFIGVATRRGLLRERRARAAEALPFYRQEADRLFLAAYKVTALDPRASRTSESALLRRFLTADARVLDALAMNPTTGTATEPGWGMTVTGEFTRTFTVNATGRYAIDLIARGDFVNGFWPIVIVYLDDRGLTQQYVSSPVWDVFEIREPLLAGRHTIRLVYANALMGLDAPGKRGFYLERVIVRPESN